MIKRNEGSIKNVAKTGVNYSFSEIPLLELRERLKVFKNIVGMFILRISNTQSATMPRHIFFNVSLL